MTADLLELIALLQFLGQGDGVDRPAGIVEVADGRVDHLVRIAVEVVGAKEHHNIMQGLVVEQDAAEHAALGFEVLGGQAIAGRGGAVHYQSSSATIG